MFRSYSYFNVAFSLLFINGIAAFYTLVFTMVLIMHEGVGVYSMEVPLTSKASLVQLHYIPYCDYLIRVLNIAILLTLTFCGFK